MAKKARRRDADPIYFGGFSGAPGIQPALPSLAAEYIPLKTMDARARLQAFGLWLGIVHVHGTDDYAYRPDVPAADDPLLVLQFSQDYEAGGWRKLGRGLTVEESALVAELSTGQGVMTLINSDGPAVKTPRITRKLTLDAHALLELVTANFTMKGAGRRHPLTAMFYDGKMGHCIGLVDADPSGTQFAFNDPWPGHSLLCAGYNAAGVAARSLGTTKIHFGETSHDIPVWGVTRDELARVIVATMISLQDWPRIMFGMVSGALSPGLRQKLRAALMAQADAAET
jgi:hypothetical protein